MHQIVAWNMAFFRRAAGMTQADLGARLGWSFRAVSAAERTAARTDGKGRQFDAETLVALSLALEVPLVAFFLPPGDDRVRVRYLFHAPEKYSGHPDCMDMSWLLQFVVLPITDDETPVADAYRDRFNAAVHRYLERGWANTAAAWLQGERPPDALADLAVRLRTQSIDLSHAAAEFSKLADAIDETAAADKTGDGDEGD
jgi:transcriptional regulator with XRE-family HTH domain